MSDTGWIKIHRKIYDNPYASDPHWVALWVWMLCRATRTERRARIGKTTKTFTLQPGQFISGRKQMANETGIDQSKIRRILKVMKNDHQIDQRPSPAGSLFTVLNWESHQKVTNETTNGRPTDDQRTTTKQEGKKERKKEIEDIYVDQDKPEPRVKIPFDQILDMYHDQCPTMPTVKIYTPSRKQAVRNRYNQFKDHPKGALWPFEVLFDHASKSDFLSGRNGSWKGCNFDWLMKQANFVKTIEGNYDNDR
jgi:predicted transcriptional regulator